MKATVRESQSHGETISFLYFFENNKKANKPKGSKIAVYLLLKASPIVTPA